MEFKSISSKLPRDEITQFRAYCEKKGTTPSSLIRELILRELEIPIPHNVAGKNRIEYNRENDNFSWMVDLDSGDEFPVIEQVSVEFIEDLGMVISLAIDERSAIVGKENKDSVTLPSRFFRSR